MKLEELKEYNLPSQDYRLYGGWMAIQKILGVTPLQTDAGGKGSLYRALGAGYFVSQSDTEKKVRSSIILPEMHEPYLFPHLARPFKYYGRNFGERVPSKPRPVKWFRALASNLPQQKDYFVRIMVHGEINWEKIKNIYEELIDFLVHTPQIKIVWPDPNEDQWKIENSPLDFYKRTYEVSSLEEVRDMPCPIENIRRMGAPFRKRGSQWPFLIEDLQGEEVTEKREYYQSTERKLSKENILQAAEFILSQGFTFSHGADYTALSSYVKVKDMNLSLTDTFYALSVSLAHFFEKGALPLEVKIPELLGPIDYPMYELEKEPKLDPVKVASGYFPRELDYKYFPDKELVISQGLPMQEGCHLWMPAHVVVDGVNILHSAWSAMKVIKEDGHIPGVIKVDMVSEESREDPEPWEIEISVNAAEFLYAMAQEMKIAKEQHCELVIPYTLYNLNGAEHIRAIRFKGFIWRKKISRYLLNHAWIYRPKE